MTLRSPATRVAAAALNRAARAARREPKMMNARRHSVKSIDSLDEDRESYRKELEAAALAAELVNGASTYYGNGVIGAVIAKYKGRRSSVVGRRSSVHGLATDTSVTQKADKKAYKAPAWLSWRPFGSRRRLSPVLPRPPQ